MADAFAPLRAALARPGRPSSDFDLNPGTVLPEGRLLRPAGVLIGIQEARGGLSVLLTKRASHLRNHPGQIAFPGGKVDATDADAAAAALREAEEEVGLPQANVELIGTMAAHETVTGFLITPVVGRIVAPFTSRPEAGEVEEVFSIPLAHFSDQANFHVEARRWRGQLRRYYVVPYGPYYVWGATARILRALADRMAG
ncbi:MAG: CoA pyrophosphatase [Phaeovulum sp.]|uniref:CoA pyrophosphatase n=1 Tax=Phaeovulum sp. TaxID=2934796 RepID=UPI002730AAE1|nr:CoA pyrophosphatase [Phaeovulum sp.]MDP2063470.1 CoA pyrophosphatase [Phaeovulum sp.]MDP3861962.1 CoA pyrophosphatase [Phaeovulum sp.]